MSEVDILHPPFVTDDDIRWSCNLLRLPPYAFHGQDGDDHRQEVLKSLASLDVAACPGSGKTTLLVAKLAILASKWQHRSRGICVLSHTNEARRQIEAKLGNSPVGRQLLSYPHFVGTIHGFVNEFLAAPWLRSCGYPIKVIDSVVCERRRWNKLSYKIRSQLEYKRIPSSNIRIADSSFRIAKKNGQFPYSEGTEIYKKVREACREATVEGYHCYDDMFIWAYALVGRVPETIAVIRNRFPLLFIDEAQDNSEAQSAILHSLFAEGCEPVVRQRFGDPNQAIYRSTEDSGATTDLFPRHSIKKDIPNSHRFGQAVADLADPFGLVPYGLTGQGPRKCLESGAKDGLHTIFLFDDDSCACKVMSAYAELLLKTFSPAELSKQGAFWAVGQRHRPPEKEEDYKRPQYVGHYCRYYDPEMSNRDPRPQAFVHYVFAGLERSGETGEACFAVDKIAEGILRLAGMTESTRSGPGRKHRHQYVLRRLDCCADVRKRYLDMVTTLAVDRCPMTKETWDTNWKDLVRDIGSIITGEHGVNPDVDQFLEWHDVPGVAGSCGCVRKGPGNLCCYPCSDNPKVNIHIGSIHSIKGQTHMATLVLETFWHDHNLESIRPWLCGDKEGHSNQGIRIQSRLKTHYVAMTRPTHLLCLAMKRSTFGDGNGGLDSELLARLKRQGWDVKCV